MHKCILLITLLSFLYNGCLCQTTAQVEPETTQRLVAIEVPDLPPDRINSSKQQSKTIFFVDIIGNAEFQPGISGGELAVLYEF